MKQFKVIASYTIYVYTTINAKSEDDAYEIASDLDGGEFKPLHGDDLSDWSINEIVELKQ